MTARSCLASRIGLSLGIIGLALLLGTGLAHADFNPFNAYYDNIARAAAENDANKVRQLITSGSNPNETNEETRTGLHVAAINGNLSIAAILIKGRAKLDITDKLGNTPLHYAADRNQAEMAKLLLDAGAAADPINRNGATPLMMAAGRGDLEIVRALLAKGANPSKTDFTGRDAVGWASDSRRPLVIQALQRAAATKH
jgi:ankyrin repeat protein